MKTVQYRDLSRTTDWSFFDPEPAIPESALFSIHALSSSEATAFWIANVSENPQEHHPRLLASEHWLRGHSNGPNWAKEFETLDASSVEPKSLVGFITQFLDLPLTTTIYFVFASDLVYEVQLHVFLEHWRAFLLLDDEGPFLFHPESGRYAAFGPNGNLFVGRKGSNPSFNGTPYGAR